MLVDQASYNQIRILSLYSETNKDVISKTANQTWINQWLCRTYTNQKGDEQTNIQATISGINQMNNRTIDLLTGKMSCKGEKDGQDFFFFFAQIWYK